MLSDVIFVLSNVVEVPEVPKVPKVLPAEPVKTEGFSVKVVYNKKLDELLEESKCENSS